MNHDRLYSPEGGLMWTHENIEEWEFGILRKRMSDKVQQNRSEMHFN